MNIRLNKFIFFSEYTRNTLKKAEETRVLQRKRLEHEKFTKNTCKNVPDDV